MNTVLSQPEQLRGQRHALRVVAGAGRDDAAGPLLLRQPGHPHVGAAQLERAGPLQVLALERHRAADRLRTAGAALERGRPHDAGEQAPGGVDVGDGDEGDGRSGSTSRLHALGPRDDQAFSGAGTQARGPRAPRAAPPTAPATARPSARRSCRRRPPRGRAAPSRVRRAGSSRSRRSAAASDGRVVLRDQQPGAAVLDRLGHAAHRRRDDGETGEHRLDDRQRPPLGAARQDQDVGAAARPPRPRSSRAASRGRRAPGRRPASRAARPAAALADDGERRARHVDQGVEQDVVALDPVEPPDGEQPQRPVVGRPDRRRPGSGTRFGTDRTLPRPSA